MKILSLVWMKKEARMFDTKEFLAKTFIAVVLGYMVGNAIPYVSKDMISLLFGMVLTIEPVNMTGIRSGFKQLEATVIGAVITSLVLVVFGYNAFAAALGVMATLYVSLVIDWRQFSVVAVFTSIYMTQYVQLGADGLPSQWATFQLRIAALFTGVAIALVVNYVFSLLGYRHMLEKRILHLVETLKALMNEMKVIYDLDPVNVDEVTAIQKVLVRYPDMFNQLDWIYATLKDVDKDPLRPLGNAKKLQLQKLMKMTELLREMGHLSYDIAYLYSKGNHEVKEERFAHEYRRILTDIDILEDQLMQITKNKTAGVTVAKNIISWDNLHLQQLEENCYHISALCQHYLNGDK